MTIIDLHKLYYAETVDERWLPNITPLQEIFARSGYTDNHKMIDNYFTSRYASLIVNSSMFDFTADNVRSQIQNHISSVLYSNLESIKRQFELVESTYNPLENYDRYEELDKETVTTTNAPRSKTELFDKVTNNSISKTTGYNENTLVTDSGMETSSSGTASGGKIENLTTEIQTIDTSVKSGTGASGKINNHLHGNIGVTQATEMMENHFNFWDWFNFFEYLFNISFEFISLGIYDTEDFEESTSTPTPTPTPTPTTVKWEDIEDKPTLLTPLDIVDTLTSLASDKVLSAKQGNRLFTMYEDTSELVNQVEASLETTQEAVQDNTDTITSVSSTVVENTANILSLNSTVEQNTADIEELKQSGGGLTCTHKTHSTGRSFVESYKYSDGRLQIIMRLDREVSITTAIGSMFKGQLSYSGMYDYPIQFVSLPSVLVRCNGVNIRDVVVSSNPIGSTVRVGSIDFLSPISQSGEIVLTILADGRWK